MTTAAHVAASGALPHGSSMVMAAMVCATTGAVAGVGRRLPPVSVVLALGLAQLLGHLTLVVAGGAHHAAGGWGFTPAMLLTHGGAAVALGLAISAVEHLYTVCASVLCWLRLFANPAQRPAHRGVRRAVGVLVVPSEMLRCGLRMRAPPRAFAPTA